MSKKLLAIEGVEALIEKENAKAIKADRKRITDGLKEYKATVTEEAESTNERIWKHKAIAEAGRVVRDAA